MDCKFCKRLKDIKDIHKIAQGWSTEAEIKERGKYMQELTVAIVVRTWFQKHGKNTAGRTVSFRSRGIGFDLNYCPECGRKL